MLIFNISIEFFFSFLRNAVKPENNIIFRKLLESFHEETKCPVLLNTSFNIKCQPIVNSPDEVIDCFLGTNIDVLAIGDFILEK